MLTENRDLKFVKKSKKLHILLSRCDGTVVTRVSIYRESTMSSIPNSSTVTKSHVESSGTNRNFPYKQKVIYFLVGIKRSPRNDHVTAETRIHRRAGKHFAISVVMPKAKFCKFLKEMEEVLNIFKPRECKLRKSFFFK